MTEKIIRFAVWDDAFNDFLMVPGPDGYCHPTMEDLKLLLFCLNGGDAKIVKVTIEDVESGSGLILAESR
jgi:hypothetical protein